MSLIEEAFEAVCAEAQESEDRWVSLYKENHCYGGAEEGGWYYTTSTLVSAQSFDLVTAELVKSKIEEKVKELNAQARRSWSDRCGDLDGEETSDLYREEAPDEDSYFVTVEEVRGSLEQHYRPHYE